MTIITLPLQQCSGCSFFVIKGASEVVSQFDLGSLSTPADESVFTPGHFEGVSLGKTLGCNRMVWDLTPVGPADWCLHSQELGTFEAFGVCLSFPRRRIFTLRPTFL